MTKPPRERLVVVAAVPDELRARLSASHELVELAQADPAERFRIAVTTSMAGFDAALMDRLAGLALIACNAVGLDRIDLTAAEARNIRVRNTPGVLTEDVADAAIGLMYAVARRIAEADRFVRAGRWGPEKMPLSQRIAGATLGIVGMGQIGQAIARRGQGLGMNVLYTSPSAKPDLSWTWVADVEALARAANVLILACPGGPATAGMIDARILAALGPAGFLVNVARGEVVVEGDLIAALQARSIGGAALDVFESEPAIDRRFFDLDNVVLQPHYAALTAQTRADIAAKLDRDIAAYLAQAG